MSSINFDILVRNVVELDSAVKRSDKLTILDKIQDIIRHLETLNPAVKTEIAQLFGKTDAAHFSAQIFWDFTLSKSPLEKMEEDILSILAKAFPSLKMQLKIDQQKSLIEALSAPVLSKETIEKILKEGVDLNILPPASSLNSWLSAVLNRSDEYPQQTYELIKLFLQHGARIVPENKKALIDFLFGTEKRLPLPNDELLELLMDRGFDICQDGALAFKSFWYRGCHNLIFYGADVNYESYHTSDIFTALCIRREILVEMDRNLPPKERHYLSKLTMEQRQRLAKRCQELYHFNEAWSERTFCSDKVPDPQTAKQIKLHEAFLNALMAEEADFDQASKLLKEGQIELNAQLMWNGKRQLVPLLFDACYRGNVKLVDWLLRAGANPNVCINTIPPLLATVLYPNPNQSAILDLLLKAGADVHLQSQYGWSWVITIQFEQAIKDVINSGIELNFMDILKQLIQCGLDINISHESRGLWHLIPEEDGKLAQDFTKALIYYGFEPKGDLSKEQQEAIKLRDETLAEMIKEDFLKEEALKSMSADVVGIIAAYHPYSLRGLTPGQRITLAERCHAKTDPKVLIRNFIEMQAAFSEFDTRPIDSKLHDFSKQLDLFLKQLSYMRPDVYSSITKLYDNLDLKSMWLELKSSHPTIKAKAQEALIILKNAFREIISIKMPELGINAIIEQQLELARTIDSVHKDFNYGKLEKIKEILEQPIELNVKSCFLRPGQSWLDAILNSFKGLDSVKPKLIELLLQAGTKVVSTAEKEGLCKHLFSWHSHAAVNKDVLELLDRQGFNITMDGTSALKHANYAHVPLLIFYGAGKREDASLPLSVREPIQIREEVLAEMNKELPPGQQIELAHLSMFQRRELAARCFAVYRFRKAMETHANAYPQTLPPELEAKIAAHAAFVKACRNGDFERAGKLLKEGRIDINAPVIHHENDIVVPLLVYACNQGNPKLVKWLLDAGANPNVCKYDEGLTTWRPPIFTAIFSKQFNAEVMDLLLKAGADIHSKNYDGKPWFMTNQIFAMEPYINRLLQCGLDFNLTYNGKRLFNCPFPPPYKAEMERALVYYGYDTSQEKVSDALQAAIKLRDEVFAEMVKESLLKEESIKSMSADLIGIIASYNPLSVADLTPAHRLKLAARCYAKAKA